MLRHLYEILQFCDGVNGTKDFESYQLPVEAVLAITDDAEKPWVCSRDDRGDEHFGCIDADEFDEVLDAQFTNHGPSTVEHDGCLYVLAGDWRYPIYFRFERKA